MSVSADTFALKTEQQQNRLQTRFSMHDCEPKHRRGKDGEGASPKRTIPVSQAVGSDARPGGDDCKRNQAETGIMRGLTLDPCSADSPSDCWLLHGNLFLFYTTEAILTNCLQCDRQHSVYARLLHFQADCR